MNVHGNKFKKKKLSYIKQRNVWKTRDITVVHVCLKLKKKRTKKSGASLIWRTKSSTSMNECKLNHLKKWGIFHE